MVLVRPEREEGLETRDCQEPEVSRFNEAAEKLLRDSRTRTLGVRALPLISCVPLGKAQRLSFLICRTGTTVVSASQGCCEGHVSWCT